MVIELIVVTNLEKNVRGLLTLPILRFRYRGKNTPIRFNVYQVRKHLKMSVFEYLPVIQYSQRYVHCRYKVM